jgi:hypothetical protein
VKISIFASDRSHPSLLAQNIFLGLYTLFFHSIQVAMSQEAPQTPISFQVNHSALSYYDITEKSDGRSDRVQKTVTTSRYTELVVNVDAYHIHLFPIADGSPIQLGFDAFNGIEVGLTASHNAERRSQGEASWKSTLAGVYAVYTLPAQSSVYEFVVGLDYLSGSQEERDESNEAIFSRFHGMDQYFGLNFVHRLKEKFSFVASTTLITTQQAEVESHRKTHSTNIGLTPLGFRLDL